MKKLYLDHHVLVDESQWPLLRDITGRGVTKLALSSWNLVEIAQANDANQRHRRIEYVSSLSPVFVHDKITLQRFELRNFAWLYYFQAGFFPFSAFAVTFPDYLLENFNIPVRPDYALADYFRNARPEHLVPIRAQQDEAVLALQALQTASRQRLAQIEKETFALYLTSRLPVTAPDGTHLSDAAAADMAEFCFERRDTLYRLSPALFVEEELSAKRRQNAVRRPSRSDVADLMHSVVGLAYCDAFVTRDGFARACCDHAKAALDRQGVRTAKLFRTLGEFVATEDEAN